MEFYTRLVEEFEKYEEKLPEDQIMCFLKEGKNYPLLRIAMLGYITNEILNKNRLADYFVVRGVDKFYDMATIFLTLFRMHLHKKYIFYYL